MALGITFVRGGDCGGKKGSRELVTGSRSLCDLMTQLAMPLKQLSLHTNLMKNEKLDSGVSRR